MIGNGLLFNSSHREAPMEHVVVLRTRRHLNLNPTGGVDVHLIDGDLLLSRRARDQRHK